MVPLSQSTVREFVQWTQLQGFYKSATFAIGRDISNQTYNMNYTSNVSFPQPGLKIKGGGLGGVG